MTAPHWMKWYKPVVDCAKYEIGLLHMMKQIMARPVIFGIEVGLGWGISASVFLEEYKDAAIISFDIEPELEARTELGKLHGRRFAYAHPDNRHGLLHGMTHWLYIDGGHEYGSVVTDIERFEQFLEPGGVIAFDDYGTDPKDQWHYPGVKQAVDEFMAANPGRYTPLQVVKESPTKPAWAVRLP